MATRGDAGVQLMLLPQDGQGSAEGEPCIQLRAPKRAAILIHRKASGGDWAEKAGITPALGLRAVSRSLPMDDVKQIQLVHKIF